MGVFNHFPYTNIHELNLDWIIRELGEVKKKEDLVDEAVESSKENADSAQQSADDAELTLNILKGTIVTPEMFGAIGDGVTDDSSAIEDALDSGKTLYLTKRYKAELSYTGDVTITGNPDSEIIGSLAVTGDVDISNIKLTKSSSTNFLFTANHGKLYANNCVFDGNGDDIFSCVQLNSTVLATVKNCKIFNSTGRNGIAISSSSNVTVENCYITSIYGPGIQTFDICNNIRILNNFVYNTNIGVWTGDGGSDGCISTYGDTTGTGTTPSENFEIRGNIIYNDMIVEANTGVAVRLNGVKNCYFDHNFIYNPFFVGLLIQDRVHTTGGVDYIVKNESVEVSNNMIITPTKNIACAIVRGGVSIYIKNNVLKNTSTDSYTLNMITFGQSGIATSINDYLLIENNRFESISGAGRKQPFTFANKPKMCIIKNNVFNTGGGMNGSIERLWLLDNIIHTTDHNLVVNLTADYAFVANNIYSYGTANGTFTVNATNSVYNQNNNPDGGMYAV